MSTAAVRFGGVADRFGGLMSRAQALRLRSLAEEAYQPDQYARDLTSEEAERRIDALRDRKSVV